MKKLLAALLVAVLMLGTWVKLSAAGAFPALEADDDEDEIEEGDAEDPEEEPEGNDREDELADQGEGEADSEDALADEDGDREDVPEEEDEDGEHVLEEEDRDNDDALGDEDHDRDDVEDEKESEEERKLETEVSESAAKVESKIETEYMENEFEIQYTTSNAISIGLEYRNETDGDAEKIEAELDLWVRFLAIVEYLDKDASRCLTTNDTVLQTLDLKDLTYSQPEVTNITSADGEAGYRFESVGTLNEFRFNITAVLFSTYALVDNTLVSPTETKITISITNFPFENDSSTLALQVEALSTMKVERGNETMESEIKVRSSIAEGYFSWENWAMVDGVNRTVSHSFMDYDDGTLISLCYPHGSNIVHDPELGVGIKLPPLSADIFRLVTPELIAGTGILVTALTAVAVVFGRGRKPLLTTGMLPVS